MADKEERWVKVASIAQVKDFSAVFKRAIENPEI